MHVAIHCTKPFIHTIITVHAMSAQSFATSFLAFAFSVLADFKTICGFKGYLVDSSFLIHLVSKFKDVSTLKYCTGSLPVCSGIVYRFWG